jgi:hypothetical protein
MPPLGIFTDPCALAISRLPRARPLSRSRRPAHALLLSRALSAAASPCPLSLRPPAAPSSRRGPAPLFCRRPPSRPPAAAALAILPSHPRCLPICARRYGTLRPTARATTTDEDSEQSEHGGVRVEEVRRLGPRPAGARTSRGCLLGACLISCPQLAWRAGLALASFSLVLMLQLLCLIVMFLLSQADRGLCLI